MKIINFTQYLDGGTTVVETDQRNYAFDERLGSKTIDRLYLGYPQDDNSNLIENSSVIEIQILEALTHYENDFYKHSIPHFVEYHKKRLNE